MAKKFYTTLNVEQADYEKFLEIVRDVNLSKADTFRKIIEHFRISFRKEE